MNGIVLIYLIYTFWNMIHSNIKHINLVQAYRKLEYICGNSLPFSILKKTMIYVLIQ